MLMTTKSQRLRVAELLDGLACQEKWLDSTINQILDGDERLLAWDAYNAASWDSSTDTDWFRYHYAEAAQLLREGSVK